MVKTPDDVAAELALSPEEGLALTCFEYRMLQRDIAAESSDKKKAKKRPVRDEFRSASVNAVSKLAEGDAAADLKPWASEFIARFSLDSPSGRLSMLEEGHVELGKHLTRRSRALLLLIDLYGFDPWTDAHWVEKTRQATLTEVRQAIPSLRPEDLESIASEYKAVIRALKRESIRWGRVLLIAGGGVALGVLTAGLAAPIIGAAVGGALYGLSGAAATSAGLAALGGGSLAAGGLGMAGGTALIAGVGGVAGAGTATAGGKWTGWTAGQVVADAIKLQVVTRLVLIDAEGDDEKARKVVEGLHERIRGMAEQVANAADLVRSLREEISALKDANEQKDAELEQLKAERKEAEEHLDELELAQSALELAADRIEGAL